MLMLNVVAARRNELLEDVELFRRRIATVRIRSLRIHQISGVPVPVPHGLEILALDEFDRFGPPLLDLRPVVQVALIHFKGPISFAFPLSHLNRQPDPESPLYHYLTWNLFRNLYFSPI